MDLMSLTAVELGKKIQAKEVTVEEAVKAAIASIKAKEEKINSFVTIDEEGALKKAAEVQAKIDAGELKGALAGVPVAIKDNMCTEGLLTTCSSKILYNFIPTYTAEAVKRLEDAGCVIVGKTNMDEFAMGSTTETSAFGVTKNPWNTEHVPGGSSGGSCAAVAAEEVPFALGSDTGGSIRQPSSFCGVTGIKPTYGTVSRYGLIAYGSSLDQIGPIAKDVTDCATILEAIASYDTKDSTSVNRDDLKFTEALVDDVKGMKIGIPKDYLGDGLDPEVKSAILAAADELKKKGAVVEEFDLGLVEYAIPAYYVIACAEASSNLARFDGVKYGYRTKEYTDLHNMYKKSRSEGFGPEVKRRKLVHDEWEDVSIVDYNRSGVPLIEIVSEPDMRSAEEVIAYLETLRQTIQYLGASDCKLNEGSMRADVNISVREVGAKKFGTRTEMKNLNSFKAIAHAIEGERERQIELLEMGRKVVQETRRWDDNKESSHAMRSKEDARDYRYFPEPDLVPIVVSDEWIAQIKAKQPELRPQKLARYKKEYDIPEYDAKILTESKHMADIFEAATKLCGKPKKVSNWLMVETMRLLKDNDMDADEIKFSPVNLAKLVDLVDAGTINSSVAKEVFEKIFREDIDPEQYVEENGLKSMNDEGELKATIQAVIDANPQAVEDYHNGKKKAIGALVGQTMKATKGKANPAVVNKLLMELL